MKEMGEIDNAAGIPYDICLTIDNPYLRGGMK